MNEIASFLSPYTPQCVYLDMRDPAVLTVLGTCVLLAYMQFWVRQHPNTPGQRWFGLATMSMAWWLVITALELSAPDKSCTMFWGLVVWPGVSVMPTAWAFFLYEYALARKVSNTIRLFGLYFFPLIISVAALTNPHHGQFYQIGNETIADGTRMYVLYQYGPLFYATILYIYLVILCAAVIAGAATWSATRAVRDFFYKLLFVTFLPVVANIAYLTTGATVFGTDPTPYFFSLSLVGIVWLMLDNRWIDMTSIGRDLLYSHTHDPILIVATDGHLCEANPEATRVFGITGRFAKVDLSKIEDIGEIVHRLRYGGENFEPPIIRRGGRTFAARIYPIDLAHVKQKLGWVIALMDVSAERDAAERAQAADLAKTQFLSTVSHELRTPLTVIKGAISLMASKQDSMTPDKLERLIKLAQENSSTLAQLVDDLLDVQRLENASFTFDMETVDLTSLARTALKRIENYQTNKPVDFSFESVSDPLYVECDPHRLGQVLTNILSNAIKFSSNPGVVRLRLKHVEGVAKVMISGQRSRDTAGFARQGLWQIHTD